MRYEYIGYFAADPFDDSTVTSFRGYVDADTKTQAYDKSSIELNDRIQADSKISFLNWYVRPAVETVSQDKDTIEVVDALVKLQKDLQARLDAHYYKSYQNISSPVVEFTQGPKYIRIVKRERHQEARSVWGFVDKVNGNVYYPAGWKAPTTKHVRGNIVTDYEAALDLFGVYGMRTLR